MPAYPASGGPPAPAGDLDTGGLGADLKTGLGLVFSNLIPTLMILGLPLIGGALVSGGLSFLGALIGLPILATVGGLVGIVFSLINLIAIPALWYFIMQAHLGNQVSWLSAYKAVLSRGVMGLVNFYVASIIGFIALFWPLGFFVGPIWLVEDDRKFFDINMRNLELWKPAIVRSIVVTLLCMAIMVGVQIGSGILAAIFAVVGSFGVALGVFVMGVVGACANAFVMPVLCGATVRMYFDMRREVDGVDATEEARQKVGVMASGGDAIQGGESLGQLGSGYGPGPGGPGPGPGGYPGPGAGGYPPGQGGYPPPGQGGYPPGQGGYPPGPGGGYPPPGQGGYPPPAGGPGNYPYGGQQ